MGIRLPHWSAMTFYREVFVLTKCRVPSESKSTAKYRSQNSTESLPFFYVSLRFLCKFDERLWKNQKNYEANFRCT